MRPRPSQASRRDPLLTRTKTVDARDRDAIKKGRVDVIGLAPVEARPSRDRAVP